MSRSYKKRLGYKDCNKFMKRYANHRLRHKTDVPDGGSYKKYTNPYDLCDWTWFWYSEEEMRHFYCRYPFEYTEERIIREIWKARSK